MAAELIDGQYENLLRRILREGNQKSDRTGVGTISLFGAQMRFDLAKSFPLITTKKIATRLVIEELLWMLAGESNIERLVQKNVHIWNEWPFRRYLLENHTPLPKQDSFAWKYLMNDFVEGIRTDHAFAQKWGELGPVYGYQWRHWPTADGGEIDQIARVLDQIKNSPDSRRIMVSAWNVADIEEMAAAGLPPCHALFQFYVANGRLSCHLYQRSCDMFLGVPFNIASYSFLTTMIAQQTELEPGEFIWTGGDCHIYLNHIDQVNEQLSRSPRLFPTLELKKAPDLFSYSAEDFVIRDYNPWPAIKAPIAV